MMDFSWNIDPEERDPEITGAPRPLLGTWHYLRSSLKRERWTWVGLGALGALLGLAVLVLLPPSSKAAVTLLMAHPASLDRSSAMGTDVSLLTTREVAERTVRQLGLPITPEAFQMTVKAEPVTTEILMLTVSAPNNDAALSRTDALTRRYLDFRATQLRSLSDGLINGYEKRIAGLQKQANALAEQYSAVVKEGPSDPSRGNEILARRAGLEAQVNDIQQAIESASLSTEAAISSTHVVDRPRLLHQSTKRMMVLTGMSGLIVGTALGVGFVLFRALTSDRVRQRRDVALALGTPVRFSVPSLGPGQGGVLSLSLNRRRRRGWRNHDLEYLVHGLSGALLLPSSDSGAAALPGPMPATPARGTGHGLALASVGNARVAASLVAALAAHLRGVGVTVFLVDLSASGALVAAATRASAPLGVFRPAGVPGLARGPRRGDPQTAVTLATPDGWLERWRTADVVLVLAEVNPGIDAENLTTWVSEVVPLVTAGRSTPELLETTSELVRAAGLSMPFALLLGSDDTDESSGLVRPSSEVPPESATEQTVGSGRG